MYSRKVNVYDSDRKTILGIVSNRLTSVGLEKLFNKSFEYCFIDKRGSWVVKNKKILQYFCSPFKG